MAKSETDVTIGTAWLDLTVAYPELAGVPARVQNKSMDFVEVNFSPSATAPVDNSGYRVLAGDQKSGTAAHIWVRSESGSAILACGLDDPASGGGGGGGAVTEADGADVALGAKADAAYTDTTGAAPASGISLFKGFFVALSTVIAKLTTINASVNAATPAGTNNIGTVLGPLPAFPVVGQQALTASAVALPANALQNGIIIKALPANTGTVYIGAAGVTTGTGYPLAAGEPISFAVANSSGIFIIGTNTTDKIAYAGN